MSSLDNSDLKPPAPNVPLQYVDEAARFAREQMISLEKVASRLNIQYYRNKDELKQAVLTNQPILTKLYELDKDNKIFSQIARDLGCSPSVVEQRGAYQVVKETVEN